MAHEFFDKVYKTRTQASVESLYDDWAGRYEADVVAHGYRTPARCAAALACFLAPKDAPILDFACGTGLSGAALAAEGFAVIDGVDLSAAMLDAARARGIYRTLHKAEPGAAPAARPGDYAAIAAIGALSPGAAPARYFDVLVGLLAPGGLFVLSYNDHTLDDPDYTSRLSDALDAGVVAELFREHGDHLVELGSKSTVFVLQKADRPA